MEKLSINREKIVQNIEKPGKNRKKYRKTGKNDETQVKNPQK